MSQRKILLLENVAAQAAGVRERLALAGFQVAVSRYEAEGLKKLGAWQPELVLLSTAHPAGNLMEYCLRVRSLAPSARIVLTSSLNRERLFQEFPGLASVVEAVLVRPYSFDEVSDLLRQIPGGEAADVSRGGKIVAVLDRDPGTLEMIRRTLRPHGLEVAELPMERIAAFCREHRPAVLVLEWPLSTEFISGALTELRTAPDGSRLPVLLISGAAQDAVSQAAPNLMSLVDMFFRKPVAWEHFFPVLRRYLNVQDPAEVRTAPLLPPAPASASASASASANSAMPPPGGEDELRARFQSQLEAKFLEVEELRRRLAAAGGEPSEDLLRLREENGRLRQAVLDGKKKAELSLAMENLKRSELEVKLDNLLRMKEEFERRTEDLLESQAEETERVRRELAEAREGGAGALREHEALRGELERLLVEKERLEERLHTTEELRQREQTQADAQGEVLAALENEIQSRRAQAAEADAAVADVAAKHAVLEEELARERERRSGAERRLDEETRRLREQAESLEKRSAELIAQQRSWEEKARAHEEVKTTVVAEAEDAVADLMAKNTALLEELGRERDQREAAAARLREEVRSWRAKAEEQEREIARLQERQAALEREVAVGERAQECVAAGETAIADLSAKNMVLAEELGRERELRGRAEARLTEEARGWQEKAEAAERELGAVRARAPQVALEEVAVREDALRGAAAERDALRARCVEIEAKLTAELRSWREKVEANELEIGLLRARGEERVRRETEERKILAERLAAAEQAGRELEKRSAAERERLETDGRALLGKKDEELRAVLHERDEAGDRLRRVEEALVAGQEARRAAEEALRGELEAARGTIRDLEERPPATVPTPENATGVQEELHRLQQVFEEVVSRARTEAVEYARREAVLESRLQGAVEEKRQVQERFDRALAEAAERDRRAATLLESALKRGAEPTTVTSHPPVERDNLPAIIPPPAPLRPGRRTVAVAVVGLSLGIAVVAGYSRWFHPSRPDRPRAPVVRGTGRETAPAQPARPTIPPPALAGPREVWERWTRSDVSGGVLLQATLRSEQELRAEVEAERSVQGWNDETARREVERLLGAYRFDESYYFSVSVKNLQPGYPSYLNELSSRFYLRDDQGNETRAFLPEGHEKDRTVYSFGAGEVAKTRDEFVYEATIPLAFSRKAHAANPKYLQLLVYDVGTTSRRVLTWELE